jgi:hypothetical protein
MSILALTYPVQVAAPVMHTVVRLLATVIRPLLLGVGTLATMAVMFRPMVKGVFQATWLVFNPRLSLEERNNRSALKTVMLLNRMAREMDHLQPNQAAELRFLASRG